MRALVLHQKQYSLQDRPCPNPVAGEILVDVELAGVCETDLQLIKGYMNYSGVLGHEFVGTARSGRWAGRRVVGEINCCDCESCRADSSHRQHCPQRTVLGILGRDGVFAEQVALPEENLWPVPDRVENDRAVFTEPLAAAFQILEQVSILPQEPVIVLGDGRLGYLVAQVLAHAGRDVRVVGKHSAKLARFASLGLATCLLNEIPAEWKSRRSTRVVVDCTGSDSGLELALQLVAPRGTVVLKSTVSQQHQLSLAAIVIDEITVIGSRCGPFSRALAALERDEIEVRSLITARRPLADIEAALALASQPQHFKVLIEIA